MCYFLHHFLPLVFKNKKGSMICQVPQQLNLTPQKTLNLMLKFTGKREFSNLVAVYIFKVSLPISVFVLPLTLHFSQASYQSPDISGSPSLQKAIPNHCEALNLINAITVSIQG